MQDAAIVHVAYVSRAPATHRDPLLRIRGSSSVDLITSESEDSGSEEEQRVEEEEIRSQDFIVWWQRSAEAECSRVTHAI
eukprot:87407-Amphidinium_carterae.1